MIYFYNSISPHPVENLHNYLQNFYLNMFAGRTNIYNHAILISEDFQPIVDEYTDQIDNKLKAIFEAYEELEEAEKGIFQTAYNNNNDISGICSGNIKPYKFSELPTSIREATIDFHEYLWDRVMTKYVAVIRKCGTIKQHFDAFRLRNSNVVCPFCGMEALLCQYDDGRDDYDHYIPKAKYPFCTVNFLNLVPICHKCNSKNKGQTDTPYNEEPYQFNQREIFYPYDTNILNHSICLSINSTTKNLTDTNSWTLTATCLPDINSNKKEAWMQIFNINARYKSAIAKRHNDVWFQRLQKRFLQRSNNKQNAIILDDLKAEFEYSYEEIKDFENGILIKCYYEFLFSDPHFEDDLRGLL